MHVYLLNVNSLYEITLSYFTVFHLKFRPMLKYDRSVIIRST